MLALKLNKVSFIRFVAGLLGRRILHCIISLLVQFLKNVYTSKVPLLLNEVEVLKATRAVGNNESLSDVYQQNGTHLGTNQPLVAGHILPLSPKKARTGARDLCSALGLNGKTNVVSQQAPNADCSAFHVILKNGESIHPHSQKAVHHQGLHQYLEVEAEFSCDHPAKISTVSPVNRISVQSKDWKDCLIQDDGREVSAVRFLHPPLGIPFCAASTGCARRALPLVSSSKVVGSSNIGGGLLDTKTLRECMEQIIATQGLDFRRGVTGLCQHFE